MRFDKLTTQFQEALGDAQSLAAAADNPYIEPVHLLGAMLQQDGPKALEYASWATVPAPGPSFTAIEEVVGASGDLTREDYQAYALDTYLEGLRALRRKACAAGRPGRLASG